MTNVKIWPIPDPYCKIEMFFTPSTDLGKVAEAIKEVENVHLINCGTTIKLEESWSASGNAQQELEDRINKLLEIVQKYCADRSSVTGTGSIINTGNDNTGTVMYGFSAFKESDFLWP